MQLNERLVSLRKENKISQIELANKLNVSRQAVSRWEVGSAVPSIENLKALSEIYGVSVDFLLGRELVKVKESEMPDREEKEDADITRTSIEYVESTKSFEKKSANKKGVLSIAEIFAKPKYIIAGLLGLLLLAFAISVFIRKDRKVINMADIKPEETYTVASDQFSLEW